MPVKLPPANEGFPRALFRVNLARSELDQLNDTLRGVPVRQPVTGEIDETSPFGVREDPFLHEAAMHTGMDIRGELGEPVHATAGGRVAIAGWDGGYGNMVEIDHGNGLATRYGHLSQIDVRVGDERPDRPNHRADRLDRPLDRPASALRDARRRRTGQSGKIPRSRRKAVRR